MKKLSYTTEEVLEFHEGGKLDINPSKPIDSMKTLALAYTPGVAIPCLEIQKNPLLAYKYTTKNNLVAVISNGTAVLGLGDIGALAGKPVMEGKCVLMKKFGGLQAIDIEVEEKDPVKLVEIVSKISVTFGAINLEDIKAPECFYVEEECKKKCKCPVMHDDQKGTAMITAAALMNGCEILGKKLQDVKIVIVGAGAAGIASARMYRRLGAKHIYMVDTKGVITTSRTDLNKYKQDFAQDTDKKTLEEIMVGADMLLGLSGPGIVTRKMVGSMAPNPMIFALANPTPEIYPEEILKERQDAIIGTGRSDYRNQINNCMGFPYVFRGALDVGATDINEAMEMAAAKALSEIARLPVPENVKTLLDDPNAHFGRDYIIPNAFDPRLKNWVSRRVAEAAMKTGVNQLKVNLDDLYGHPFEK